MNVPTESQSKVIIENPYGFAPLNPEILRVVKPGGEIRITGTERNKHFKGMLKDSYEPPKGFKVIKKMGYSQIRKETRFSKRWKTNRETN